MRRILWLSIGMLFGAGLGARDTRATELGPRLVGDDGYLSGWDVTDSNGETVCSDPYVWHSTSELECDTSNDN